MSNVMAALPNIGGTLCSTPQSLADAHYSAVHNAAKTRNPLKLAGVPKTNETISAASRPKFIILWGHVGEILLLWSPYVIGQTIIFLPCSFFLNSSSIFFFSSPNLSGRRLDVYHTFTHGVALVRI